MQFSPQNMNSQFHTPSLGDGFDLSGVEEASAGIADLGCSAAGGYQLSQVDQFESKRMQSMEHNMSVGTNSGVSDINCTGNGLSNSGTSGIFNITAHLHNNSNNFNNGNGANNQMHTPPATMAARKQLSPTSVDSNGSPKPLSPYALFFRDTISVIKQQNPHCNFEDLKLIASTMWEALAPPQKEIYNKKADSARKDYVKQMQFQSPTTTDTSILNNPNTDNMTQDQYQMHLQQRNMAHIKSEPQEEPVETVTNANLVESSQNSQPPTSIQVQEGNSQSMPIAKESEVMEMCIRDGCNNRAIMNPDWEDEYCSNECVVIHCRNVFNDWVQQNRQAAAIQP